MTKYIQNGDAIFRDSVDGELVYDGVDRVNGQRIIDLLETIDALESQIAKIPSRAKVATNLIAAIEAIDVNPLATTPRQHVEFTKRDAVDAVKRWLKEKE